MRYSQTEKMEIIKIVQESEFGVNRTLKELGIHKSTFYQWYGRYQDEGYDGLAPRKRAVNSQWNRIPDDHRQKVVEIALDLPELSPRELACHITDNIGFFISESSVYRILKSRGLITSPAHILMRADREFKNKTTRVNQMWQTDFTYFKIIGWGWYYLSTVLDDYSRYIVSWELCTSMKAADVSKCLHKALDITGLTVEQAPKLLSDNGSCYISEDLKAYVQDRGIKHIRGAPGHPQTQGKIERYHRSMKNVIKLDNYHSPQQLNEAIAAFVTYYNTQRYHEALNNITPEDVFVGRQFEIFGKKGKTKTENH